MPGIRKVGFEAVKPEDVTDLALLPRRFDLFAGEVREGFSSLTKQFMPILNRVESSVVALVERVAHIEQTQAEDRAEIAALRATVAQLDKARRIEKSRSGERRGKKNS